jgi:hypothetical protein
LSHAYPTLTKRLGVRLLHDDGARREVNIGPPQANEFTKPHTGIECHDEQTAKVSSLLPFASGYQRTLLLTAEDTLTLYFGGGEDEWPAPIKGIRIQPALLNSDVEHPAQARQHPMYMSDGAPPSVLRWGLKQKLPKLTQIAVADARQCTVLEVALQEPDMASDGAVITHASDLLSVSVLRWHSKLAQVKFRKLRKRRRG